MNEKIDLSQYNIPFSDSDDDTYIMFQDGYCGITVRNDNGTLFRGVIDTNGNWVIELSDTLGEYMGRASENILIVGDTKGNTAYNMKTKEFEKWASYTQPQRMNTGYNINGRIYWPPLSGNLYCYDCETQEVIRFGNIEISYE